MTDPRSQYARISTEIGAAMMRIMDALETTLTLKSQGEPTGQVSKSLREAGEKLNDATEELTQIIQEKANQAAEEQQ